MTALKAVPKKILVLCERLDIAVFVDVYIKYLRTDGVVIPNVRIINLQCLDNLSQYLQGLEKSEDFSSKDRICQIQKIQRYRRDHQECNRLILLW